MFDIIARTLTGRRHVVVAELVPHHRLSHNPDGPLSRQELAEIEDSAQWFSMRVYGSLLELGLSPGSPTVSSDTRRTQVRVPIRLGSCEIGSVVRRVAKLTGEPTLRGWVETR